MRRKPPAEDGRRLLVGWMGVPDGEEMQQPTRAHGWIHQMTCLRELSWRHGTLYQNPVRELAALRGEAQGWQTEPLALQPMELAFEVAPDDALTLDFAGALQLSLDSRGVRLARRSRWPIQSITVTGAARRINCRSSSTVPASKSLLTMAWE